VKWWGRRGAGSVRGALHEREEREDETPGQKSEVCTKVGQKGTPIAHRPHPGVKGLELLGLSSVWCPYLDLFSREGLGKTPAPKELAKSPQLWKRACWTSLAIMIINQKGEQFTGGDEQLGRNITLSEEGKRPSKGLCKTKQNLARGSQKARTEQTAKKANDVLSPWDREKKRTSREEGYRGASVQRYVQSVHSWENGTGKLGHELSAVGQCNQRGT